MRYAGSSAVPTRSTFRVSDGSRRRWAPITRLGYVELGRRREDGFERVFFEKIVEAGSPGVAVP
jgi:hypothetical protein